MAVSQAQTLFFPSSPLRLAESYDVGRLYLFAAMNIARSEIARKRKRGLQDGSSIILDSQSDPDECQETQTVSSTHKASSRPSSDREEGSVQPASSSRPSPPNQGSRTLEKLVRQYRRQHPRDRVFHNPLASSRGRPRKKRRVQAAAIADVVGGSSVQGGRSSDRREDGREILPSQGKPSRESKPGEKPSSELIQSRESTNLRRCNRLGSCWLALSNFLRLSPYTSDGGCIEVQRPTARGIFAHESNSEKLRATPHRPWSIPVSAKVVGLTKTKAGRQKSGKFETTRPPRQRGGF